MNYLEGLAMAKKHGVEVEYEEAYNAAEYENTGFGYDKSESELVSDILIELNII